VIVLRRCFTAYRVFNLAADTVRVSGHREVVTGLAWGSPKGRRKPWRLEGLCLQYSPSVGLMHAFSLRVIRSPQQPLYRRRAGRYTTPVNRALSVST